jgi:hypothetical protein
MRVPPNAPGGDVRAALRARGGATSFELASRGGYARTVTGRVAYLDEDAQTYIVMGDDGKLLRVPLRDITSSRETTEKESDRLYSDDGRASIRASDLTGRVCASWHARGRSESGGLLGQAPVAARREPSGVPRARGRHSLADIRDVGPDLQGVRLAADVRLSHATRLCDLRWRSQR